MNAEFTLRAEVKQWKNSERVDDTSPAAFSFFTMLEKKKSGTLAIASRAAVIAASALGAEL